MLKTLSVLCPVDFSEQSQQALRWAATILQHRGGELTVLTVVDPLLASAAGIQFGIDLVERESHPGLMAFVEDTLPESIRKRVPFRLQAVIGDPAAVIMKTSRAISAQLIVMGTHGRGVIRSFLLGSTTRDVLREAECPVLMVPDGMPLRGDDLDGRLQKILLATDFGQSATAATQWAVDIATEVRIPLVLTHVVEPVIVPVAWQPLIDDLDEERVSFAQRMLARLSIGVADVRTEQVVSVGHPAEEIAAAATERGADLVVMGLNSDTPSDGFLSSSIAYKVLSAAHVAVVVVPGIAQRPTDPAGSAAGADPESHVEGVRH